MNAFPPQPETPDELDRLLSDFFKAQLKQPWPKAPLPPTALAPIIPSELVSVRANGADHRPLRSPTDTTARARFTLAASVALALGAAWLFTSSSEPSRMAIAPEKPVISDYLQRGSASGENHPLLKELPKNPKVEAAPPKIMIDDL